MFKGGGVKNNLYRLAWEVKEPCLIVTTPLVECLLILKYGGLGLLMVLMDLMVLLASSS